MARSCWLHLSFPHILQTLPKYGVRRHFSTLVNESMLHRTRLNASSSDSLSVAKLLRAALALCHRGLHCHLQEMMRFAFNSVLVCQQLHLYSTRSKGTGRITNSPKGNERPEMGALMFAVSLNRRSECCHVFLAVRGLNCKSRILIDSYHLRTERHYGIIGSSCLQNEPWSEEFRLFLGGSRDVVSFILRRKPDSWVS